MREVDGRARWRNGPWRVLAVLSVFLVAAVVHGQEAPGDRQELRRQIESRYEVLPTRDGVLLRPLEGSAAEETVEIFNGDVALGAEPVSTARLRELLGEEESERILELARLDTGELHGLFRDQMAEVTPEAKPAREPGADLEGAEPPEPAEPTEPTEPTEPDDSWRHQRRTDSKVVMGSSVRVEEDEVTGEVVAIGGSVTVDGEVNGDAVAIGGPMRVSGEVWGDTVAIGGGVRLASTAHVHGNLVSVGGRIDREPGSVVDGEITEVSLMHGLFRDLSFGRLFHPGFRSPREIDFFDGALGDLFGGLMWLLVIALPGMLLLVLARRPLERVADRVGREPWKAGLVGLASVIFVLPLTVIVVLLLLVSIIGIPLLLLVPLAFIAFLFAAYFGYVAVAYKLGRWSEARFGWRISGPVLALIIGLLWLHVWSIGADLLDVLDGPRNLAAFPGFILSMFGCLVQFAAWSAGLGGVLIARGGSAAAASSLPPLPPTPTAPPRAAEYTPPAAEEGETDEEEMPEPPSGAEGEPETAEPEEEEPPPER